MRGLDAPEPSEVDDEGPVEPPEKPTTRLGDQWLLDSHRLRCGSSTVADDVTALMAGAKARLDHQLCATSDTAEFLEANFEIDDGQEEIQLAVMGTVVLRQDLKELTEKLQRRKRISDMLQVSG